jgi:hypothetical protein
VTNTGLHELFCKSMIEFLQTNINQYSSYSVDQVILDKLRKFLQDMLSLSSDAQQISSSFDRHLKDEEAMNTVIGAINKIATSATTIPLSLFTSMMHQHFKKHTYCESTLELLQQFYLQAVSVESKKYLLFPGDLSKFSLRCGRCGKCVSPPEFISAVLFNAPQAILHHLKMKAADDDHLKMKSPNNEPALLFQSVPVLFTSCSNYYESYESFEKSMQAMSNEYCKIVHDRCTSQKSRSGELSFCEAVKVGMGALKDKK